MQDLIDALNIFLKYGNPPYPTHCEHDVLMVMIDPSIVLEPDMVALDELGFHPDPHEECFISFKFGSC